MHTGYDPTIVVSAETLNNETDENTVLVDISDAESYTSQHIPGAVHINYADIVRSEPPAMGLLGTAEKLSQRFSELGISGDTQVIAYDNENGGKAARLLYTLLAAGHQHIGWLNGGLTNWLKLGYATTKTLPDLPEKEFVCRWRNDVIADKAMVKEKIGQPNVVLLDVRSSAEFNGSDVRAARGGHIPGAVNLEWTQLIGKNKQLLDAENAQTQLNAVGVTPDKEIILYCQTHHRSAHTFMVLKALGYPDLRGYPGAWTDWANDPDCPIER